MENTYYFLQIHQLQTLKNIRFDRQLKVWVQIVSKNTRKFKLQKQWRIPEQIDHEKINFHEELPVFCWKNYEKCDRKQPLGNVYNALWMNDKL